MKNNPRTEVLVEVLIAVALFISMSFFYFPLILEKLIFSRIANNFDDFAVEAIGFRLQILGPILFIVSCRGFATKSFIPRVLFSLGATYTIALLLTLFYRLILV